MSRDTRWSSALVRFNDRIDRVLSVACAAMLTVMVLTIFVQVVGRYVLHVPTPWAEETAVYAFIWVVLLGTGLGVRDHSHLVADILPERVPPLLDRALTVLAYALIGITALVFVRYGLDYALLGRTRYSFSMGFPMIWLYIAMPISGAVMLLFLVERFVALCKGLDAPPKSGDGP